MVESYDAENSCFPVALRLGFGVARKLKYVPFPPWLEPSSLRYKLNILPHSC